MQLKRDTILKTLDITLLVSSVLLYGLYEVYNNLTIAVFDGLLLLSWFITDMAYSVIARDWSELALDVFLIVLVGVSAVFMPRTTSASIVVLGNAVGATVLGEVVLITVVAALAVVIIIRRAWWGVVRI